MHYYRILAHLFEIRCDCRIRGLYHFTQAYHRGHATDPVKYFAALENQDLGVVERLRKKPGVPPAQLVSGLAGG